MEIIPITNVNQLPAGIEFIVLENKELAEAQGQDIIWEMTHVAPKAYLEYYVPTSKEA
jgi:hypothetical protein